MHPKRIVALLLIPLAVLGARVAYSRFFASEWPPSTTVAAAGDPPNRITQGTLAGLDKEGKPRGDCPLKHTDVKAEISGFLARVTVTQQFHNPFSEPIEAVYVFPLPQSAAVDDMTMNVGARVVRGQIKRREEARAIYEAAREGGRVASLLDQERPNIFTQSVANITPGENVTVKISYVETLKYEEGKYQFVFPMVVGPRYIPGAAIGAAGGGREPDTTQVPDASRITPQITPEGTRSGHDVSLEVAVDAGVPLTFVTATNHPVEATRVGVNRQIIRLAERDAIPNKDFVLDYGVAGGKIEDAVLTTRGDKGGFFTMILQPPNRVTHHDVAPKELVFVLDTSGSMSGFPIEKAKECMKMALDNLYPDDTFNLITFAGDTHILFPHPVPATPANLRVAQDFLETRRGGGGTEMMKAIRAALDPTDRQNHVRIVCFMTDGYIGNDMQVISEIQKHPNTRVFSFGVGSSVNRFLLDKMAEHGRGEVEYVSLNDDGSAAARRFHERVRNPLMTDVEIDWNGLPVTDVYPKRIPDLFSAKPVVITGRYTGAAEGMIRLKGRMAGGAFAREVRLNLPERESGHDVLATLWARTRIEDLMAQDYAGAQQGAMKPELKETVTQLGLEYRLLTQFTSFVAVEDRIVTDGGQPRTIQVPVEMPDGVSYDGVTGGGENEARRRAFEPSQPGNVLRVFPRKQLVESSRSDAASGVKSAETKYASPSRDGAPGAGEYVASPPPPKKEDAPVTKSAREDGSKLHPALLKIARNAQNKSVTLTPSEAKLVKDGATKVSIRLSDGSEATLAALKALGVVVLTKSSDGKRVVARVPVERLMELARLGATLAVAPYGG
jgi:Ca-activated chloride channel family protein